MGSETRPVIMLSADERFHLARLVESDPEAAARWKEVLEESDQYQEMDPHPLKIIQYEGLLQTDPARISTTASLMDMDRLGVIIQVLAVSSDPCYRDTAHRIVVAWCSTYEPTGNPINENKLEAVLVAIDLLRGCFSQAEWELIEVWLRKMAARELASAVERPRSTTNNWHTKRLKLVGMIGILLDDDELVSTAAQGSLTYIDASLYPDGTSVDLHTRDALHYHISGLTPLVALSRLFKNHRNVALFDYEAPSGGSLARSIDYVLPYALEQEIRHEWTNSTADIDRRRAEAGLLQYQPGKLFDPREALELFEQAAWFRPDYLNVVRSILRKPDSRFPTWFSVLAAV